MTKEFISKALFGAFAEIPCHPQIRRSIRRIFVLAFVRNVSCRSIHAFLNLRKKMLGEKYSFWGAFDSAKNHKLTPQAPVRNRQTRKVANAKVRIG